MLIILNCYTKLRSDKIYNGHWKSKLMVLFTTRLNNWKQCTKNSEQGKKICCSILTIVHDLPETVQMNSLCLFHFCKMLRQKVEMHGIFNQLLLREKKSIFDEMYCYYEWLLHHRFVQNQSLLPCYSIHSYIFCIYLLNVKHPLIWMQNSFNVGLGAKLAHGQDA